MFCHLPRPYQDELLYSVITRYCFYLDINVGSFACLAFQKKTIRLRADLPGSLQKIAEKTYLLWGLSGEDVMNELTLFPYYAPFLPQKSAQKKIAGLIDGGYGSVGLIGVNSFRVKSPLFLRYCQECRSIDIAKYGETYWHRVHQLPGALVCAEHATPLVNSTALIQPQRSESGDATTMTDDILINDVHFDGREHFLATMVAIHCKKLLLKLNSAWETNNLSKAYRDAALERGFCKIPGIFSPDGFRSAFKDFYSKRFLDIIGISTNSDSWITTLFHMDRRQKTHPLEHILVQVFLEQMPIVASSQPFGIGPWKCPNPYGAHDDKFPIKKILLRTNRAKEVIACVRCSCGFFFTFNKTDNVDKHLPVVKDISLYGPTWKQKAESLYKTGMTVREISAIMSLRVQFINKLLEFKSKRKICPPRNIEVARNEWLQLLERTPQKLVIIARKENYGLYSFLRKYDHEWMMCQVKPRRRSVDLAKRDDEWSLLLEQAVSQIASQYPGRRIAKTLMIKVSGLNLRLMAELDKFPKCKSVINRFSEPCRIYQRRMAG